MRPILRPDSLIFKVIFVTSLILIIAISFIVWLDIRIHEDSIKRLTYEKTKIISEFIEKNVIRAMERGRHFEIHRVLKEFCHLQRYLENQCLQTWMEPLRPRPGMKN